MHRVLGLLVLIASFGGGWLWMDYREFERTPLDLPAEGLTYTLPPRGSAGSLASDLVAAGTCRHVGAVPAVDGLDSGRAAQLKAGEYRLAPGLTASGTLDLLVLRQGSAVRRSPHRGLELPPAAGPPAGATGLRQTLEGLDDAIPVMAGWARAGWSDPGGPLLSGHLSVPPRHDMRTSSFSAAPTSAWATVLDEAWRQRVAGLPLTDPYRGVGAGLDRGKGIRVAAERPQIAGVFARRLQKGHEAAGRSDRDLRTRRRLRRQPAAQRPGDRHALQFLHAHGPAAHAHLSARPRCHTGRRVSRRRQRALFRRQGRRHHYFSASLDEHQRAVNQLPA